MADCTVCERPTGDQAYACSSCSGRLARALGDVAALTEALDDAISRQTRTSSGIGVASRSADRPLPWDQHASLAASTLRGTLSTWARLVAEERGRDLPADTMPAMAAYLLGQLEWIRHHPAAAEAVEQIRDAVTGAVRAVDRRPDRLYAGPCGIEGCPGELYAKLGAQWVSCRVCSTEYDVAVRREWMLTAAEDVWATSELISAALSRLGHPVTTAMLRGLKHRGRLLNRNTRAKRDRGGEYVRDRDGELVQDGPDEFRVGDVMDILAENARAAAGHADRKAG